jgi:penicillin-binding protein 2
VLVFGREDKVPHLRLTGVQYVIAGVFLLLAFGLWRLQVMNNDKYDALAQQNRIKDVPILAPRGKLLDREGRIIVDNYPSFSALLLRSKDSSYKEAALDAIAQGLHLDADELKTRVKRQWSKPGYQPIFLKYDITPDELAFIEGHRNEFPELDTITVHRRLYPKGGFMAHMIGYVGEVNNDMLNQPRYELYNAGDVVGQSGVEAEYNDLLMGTNGSRRVLVNSKGKEVGELSDQPAIPGKAIKLTVDIDLQIAAEEALEGKNGAIIAMDPRNGEVLAMASRPTFDPNSFAVRISRKEWNDLITDPKKPLLNKAIQAQLAPGSVFKIIMSVAGWQEGISQTMQVHCGGGGTFYGRYFKCWIKGAHGEVGLTKAIAQSCDVYFYTLAERLGIGKIAQYAQAFGLGQKTGIDLPQEVSGVMPSEEWKVKNFKQKWYAGETISVGIGQGAVATTPVQLMRAIGAIASGGRMVRPHVAFPDDLPASYLETVKYSEVKQIEMDPHGWEAITDAMEQVLEPGGTAALSHVPGVDFAGKTGSAQTISNALKAKLSNKGDYKDNGWFVGVTPRRNPELVVAVLVEGGEHGSLSARLAAQVVKAYSDKKNAAHQPSLAATPQRTQPSAQPDVPPVAPEVPPATTVKPTEQKAEQNKPLEITGVWNSDGEHLHGGRFVMRGDESGHKAFKPAKFAPGMESVAQNAAPASQKPKDRKKPAKKWPAMPDDVVAILPAPAMRVGGGQR